MLVDNDQNTESSWHFPPPLSKWLFLPLVLFMPLVLFHFLAFLHPAAAVDISSLDRLADVNLQKESNILKISITKIWTGVTDALRTDFER